MATPKDMTNNTGRTPVHHASLHGHSKVVLKLLEAGWRTDVKDEDGDTPLHHAARKGQEDVVKALLLHGASAQDRNEEGQTPLHMSSFKGHEGCVELLIPATPKDITDKTGRTPVHHASLHGHSKVVLKLLEAGWRTDVKDEDGDTPLHHAAMRGFKDVVKALLLHGASAQDRNEEGATPLHMSSDGHEGCVELLIPATPKDMADNTGRTPVHHASLHGHSKVVLKLLEAGWRTDVKDEYGDTPLHHAAMTGQEEVVKALLLHGASAQDRNEEGATALHIACREGQEECFDLLLRPTQENIADNSGRTPVHHASVNGQVQWVSRLEQAGWRMDVTDSQGNTPLHDAARRGRKELVKHLLDKGLSPRIKNYKNKTPIELAEENGNREVANIMKGTERDRDDTLREILDNIRRQRESDARTFEEYKLTVTNGYEDRLMCILKTNDPHLVDKEGRTILHIMAEKGPLNIYFNLLSEHVHLDSRTHAGQTPLEVANKRLEGPNLLPDERKQAKEEVYAPTNSTEAYSSRFLLEARSHDELYENLLLAINYKDYRKVFDLLLFDKAPLELGGHRHSSALQQAIAKDWSRGVRLLLACGASLTHSSMGLNLLQQPWYSRNTSTEVHCAILTAFSCKLKYERERLLRCGVQGLLEDLTLLIEAVDGEKPWAACWPEERPMTTLTAFMTAAASVNCPLVVGFLRWAGACPCFSIDSNGTTPLHAAIQAGHLSLVEAMVRDLDASLYTPDTRGCRPRDMDQLEPGLARLEKMMYQRERRRLEALALRQKDMSEQDKVKAVLALQQTLFTRLKEGQTAMAGEVTEGEGVQALLVACRNGLLQMLHLLLAVAGLPPDTVLDAVCGTTALHEAAAHGKDGCVAHLLRILQTNTKKVVTSVKDKHLDKYTAIKPDRYGQTALHLAAMFGHKHTFQLLQHSVEQHTDTHCRAGSTAQEVKDNFPKYMKYYRLDTDSPRGVASLLTHRGPEGTLKRLLQGVDLHKLPRDAWSAKVDFNEEGGEAAQLRDAVMRAVDAMLGRAAYLPGRQVRLELVGSTRDGSKLFAPDEFDINVVVPAGDCVRVTVHKANPKQGHPCMLRVETGDPELQGSQLLDGLQQVVTKALTLAVLEEPRLSVVPPGFTPTEVGMALNLAWQGKQYPLLLVSVDLVPVLEVPWLDPEIERPPLTPQGAATIHLSATRNTPDSWRCSFALLEAEVLGSMTDEQRGVQLCGKVLLDSLKPKRWMPRRMRASYQWWLDRAVTVKVPSGFTLKTCLFLMLEKWRQEGHGNGPDDALQGLVEVFQKAQEKKQIKAYFGGDFEKAKDSPNARLILEHLKRITA